MFKIAQEKEIKSLINADEDAFDAFNKLYSDINPLLEFIACWKLFEYFRSNFEGVRAKHRKALMVYLTVRYILLDKQAEFGISQKEASAFIEEWKRQFFIKDLDSENADRLIVILDVLANSAISLENQIPNFTLEVEREGTVKIAVPFLAEALQDVNISRLRICEYCKNLFRANRKDAYTCSPNHARNRRMRLLRNNWKENGDLYLETRRFLKD